MYAVNDCVDECFTDESGWQNSGVTGGCQAAGSSGQASECDDVFSFDLLNPRDGCDVETAQVVGTVTVSRHFEYSACDDECGNCGCSGYYDLTFETDYTFTEIEFLLSAAWIDDAQWLNYEQVAHFNEDDQVATYNIRHNFDSCDPQFYFIARSHVCADYGVLN
jgi:hypothetical protein